MLRQAGGILTLSSIAGFVLLTSTPAQVRAGWNADGVTVSATSASIPLVAASSDGGYGTFVSWQEESAPGQGVLRVQHLLSTGDLDPAWPAVGALACYASASRSDLIALPDHEGGVYLLWKEGTTLIATRIGPDGQVASAWPACGRSLGAVFADSPSPTVIEDGAHGVYAAWTAGPSVQAIHLGPQNTGAGGWLGGVHGIGPGTALYDTMYWPQLALAPDGGVFVAWATASADTEQSPSAWRLRRLNSAGLNSPGWASQGAVFGAFHRELLTQTARSGLLALSPDGRGGAFLVIGDPVGPDPYGGRALVETRLYRLQGDGQSASDWPAEGRSLARADELLRWLGMGRGRIIQGALRQSRWRARGRSRVRRRKQH